MGEIMKKLLPLLLLSGCVTKLPVQNRVYHASVTVQEASDAMASSVSQPFAPTLSLLPAAPALAVIATVPGKMGAVNLAWDHSPDPTVVGYRLYWGIKSGVYTNSAPFGNSNRCQITGLDEGVRYYFAATAFDDLGIESDKSNEATTVVPVRVNLRRADWYVDAYGAAGKTNLLQRSEDMQNWTTVLQWVGDGKVRTYHHANTPQSYFRVEIKNPAQ